MSGEAYWLLTALAVGLLVFRELRYFKSGHAIAPTRKPNASTKTTTAPVQPTTFPIMTLDNITPNGQAITSVQAVKVFRLYMLAVGYLDKQELPDWGRYFAEDMKFHGLELVDRVEEEKRKLKEYSELIGAPEIRVLKRQLLKTNDNVKRDAIEREIDDYESDIREEEKYLRKAQVALQAFRTDKRQFVVDYINNLTQQKVESQQLSSS
ncbi:MAG: hypothetical protein Q8O85_04680 [Rhodoferax sp.]|uniref:hypothetical protein n=1 Tax=Rhodoferax sp. TaxID=50421 RepID=UPI0027363380|nr:hypothetical protein [Rhodoferax sp.]MDP2678007.1 hypothetical protein [Rhodoferax sp.]